ncbi:ThuA domain-containing protein [Cellulophaga baltica]|uniref:ThuA domain-containing protein n=1 Tax=Cellulophaga baltica TaxID=76594 RepID=UPI002494D87E|nr:ThuA domain-containing protein [Cellulophaga baltica]
MNTRILSLTCFIIFTCNQIAFSQDQFKVLLFTVQDTWHYECIPTAVAAFHQMATEHQFKFDWTQSPEDLALKLPSYDVVVFLNADADVLTEDQLDVLKTHLHNGKGFVGVHSTSDSKIRNLWFDNLVGGVFKDHPQFQAAVLTNHDVDFPSNMHLPEKWLWSEEWYNFEFLKSEHIKVLLSVDENTYDYQKGYDEIPLLGMGKNHPIAWYQFYEGGRSFYTTLGHKPEAFHNQTYLDHLFGGIYWAANGEKK